jgi:hypothetical protein
MCLFKEIRLSQSYVNKDTREYCYTNLKKRLLGVILQRRSYANYIADSATYQYNVS